MCIRDRRYTIRVTAQPDARRAGLDTEGSRTFPYTTQYCGGRHTEAQGGYLLGDGSAGNPYVCLLYTSRCV